MYHILKKYLSDQCRSICQARLRSTTAALPKQTNEEAASTSHHICQISTQEIPAIANKSDDECMAQKGLPVSQEMLLKEYEYLRLNRKIVVGILTWRFLQTLFIDKWMPSQLEDKNIDFLMRLNFETRMKHYYFLYRREAS